MQVCAHVLSCLCTQMYLCAHKSELENTCATYNMTSGLAVQIVAILSWALYTWFSLFLPSKIRGWLKCRIQAPPQSPNPPTTGPPSALPQNGNNYPGSVLSVAVRVDRPCALKQSSLWKKPQHKPFLESSHADPLQTPLPPFLLMNWAHVFHWPGYNFSSVTWTYKASSLTSLYWLQDALTISSSFSQPKSMGCLLCATCPLLINAECQALHGAAWAEQENPKQSRWNTHNWWGNERVPPLTICKTWIICNKLIVHTYRLISKNISLL